MKNRKPASLLFVILLMLEPFLLMGQDLTTIKGKKPFKITGGYGINFSSTATNDSNRVPMPSYWAANLNLNFSFYGLEIPVSAIFTNGKVSLNHAFNQFGISPRWKWITLHAGYRQYNYSSFTVSGQTLFGGGIDLTPGKFRFGFIAGRLRKAIEADSSKIYSQNIPGSYPLNVSTVNGTNYYSPQASYTRLGWGARIGYGTATNFVDLIFFRGYDRSSTLNEKTGALAIFPEENVVLGINIFQKFLKHFTMGVNGAASIYTYDTNAEPVDQDIPLVSMINKIITIRSSTQAQWAGEANFNINYPNFNLLTSFKRAEPNFRSMGINSYLTDLNLITVQPSWNMFKQKVRFSNVFQHQTDNLNKYKLLTTKRFLANSSISFSLTNNFGFDLNYNNNSIEQVKVKAIVPDSIQASQKSDAFTISPRYFFTNQNFSNVASLVCSYTDLKNQQMNGVANNIQNLYATINNTFVLFKIGLNINAGLNFNNTETSMNKLQSYGFIAGLTKAFLSNKLSLSNNNILLWNKLDGKGNGKTFSIDLNSGYQFLSGHSISAGFNYLYSPANGIYNLHDFQQTRILLSYQYHF